MQIKTCLDCKSHYDGDTVTRCPFCSNDVKIVSAIKRQKLKDKRDAKINYNKIPKENE